MTGRPAGRALPLGVTGLLGLLLALLAWVGPAAAGGAPDWLAPAQADVIVTEADQPPAADDPRWQAQALGEARPGLSAWYRLRFETPTAAAGHWQDPVLYLPFFYGGGRVLLNGQQVLDVPSNRPDLRVRWARPFLAALPPQALQAQGNVLLIQAHAEFQDRATLLPLLVLGPQASVGPMFERRMFLVRTLPQLTWVMGTVVGLLVLLIWLQRRNEALYGLFGLASLLWAQRTSTFVLETLPAGAWDAWRLLYHLCTGGFVIVMTLFVLRLAGWSRPAVTSGLLAYWALGPIVFVLLGEHATGRWWMGGMLLVALALASVAVAAAWRRRTAETVALALAVVVGSAAGVHDQWVATRSPLLLYWLPGWTDHRLFLLHHAANLLLLVMGVLLAQRFVRSLNAVEAANRTLETRLLERERQVAESYLRIAALQREQAATDERQRIMRDLHDGLGSQLFTSLSRAERGALDSPAMADTLRGAIDQMRVAIEALASEEQDFDTAFGNFRFRWDARLREAGIAPTWHVNVPEAAPDEAPDGVLRIAPHDALQLLHLVQEALTNVMKHAHASAVVITVVLDTNGLRVAVSDNGTGALTAQPVTDAGSGQAATGGRGRANMRNRAQRLGGQLQWQSDTSGTSVSLQAPWPPASA